MIPIAHQRRIDALTYKYTSNCKLTANSPHKCIITARSDLPDVQRNLFPHPVCSGQLFFGEQACLWIVSPVQELPPN